MYNVLDYGTMISDPVRVGAYRDALHAVVVPGSRVLDVGTGTGLLALLAARMGAAHVYAVDPSDAVQVAREIARSNGLAERITFIQADSRGVTLPEPVDVVVSDLRGVLPLHARSLRSIMDARDRLARPGASLVPMRDLLRAAPIEDAEGYARFVGPWSKGDLDLDLSAARVYAINMWRRADPPPERLLAPPETWATLEYPTLRSEHVAGHLEWRIERTGTLHGLLIWFDAELTTGIRYSNAPGNPGKVYGRAFFPLPRPVSISAGTRVTLALSAHPVGNEYIWQWETEVIGSGSGEPLHFRQSTFRGMPLSPERLALRDPTARPIRREDAAVEHAAVGLMDGEHTVAEIAALLQTRFPALFEEGFAAMEQAAALAAKFGRTDS